MKLIWLSKTIGTTEIVGEKKKSSTITWHNGPCHMALCVRSREVNDTPRMSKGTPL